MRGVNKAIVVGNVGKIDTVNTRNGNMITNLSIATDESYKDKSTGQKVEQTEWHKVVLFQRLAEIAQQYVRKGSKLYIEGSLRTRKWQDQGGNDRYTTEIVGREMQLLDSKEQGQQGQQQPQNVNQNASQQYNQMRQPEQQEQFEPDDIPF